MRMFRWLSFFCLCPLAAAAAENTSVYSGFDLEKTCVQVEKPDGYAFAGIWKCPGYGDKVVAISVSDERSFVGFGRYPAKTCAFAKTFSSFNTALSPIEWRLKRGRPLAAIQRWRVVTDDEGGTSTWLVITALKGKEACPFHYIAGSYPDANALAPANTPDSIADDFDCADDVPTVDSRSACRRWNSSPCRELYGGR